MAVDPLLLDPSFVCLLTTSLDIILIAGIFIPLLSRRVSSIADENRQRQFATASNASRSYSKTTHYSCLSLSFFYLIVCLFTLFDWYYTGWSGEKIPTLMSFGGKALSWLGLYLFLQMRLSNSRETKYPLALRVWWGLFFVLSCYSLVTDVVFYKKHKHLSTPFWASDIVSVIVGLVLCCVVFRGKEWEENTIVNLEESLLNGSDARGDENVSPYVKAGFFNLLTFSWMDSLISLGYKRTLNLGDVPQLAVSDSVEGVFRIFNDKLESCRGESTTVTAAMLAKGLFFTAWREILMSAVFVLVNVLASYVGPYLIDTFMQYLNGRRDFKREGYVLVSAFSMAKLIECIAQRHWYFKAEQAGLGIRAALVSKVYNKGLTLSCQSKQGQSTGEIINFMSVDAENIGEFSWYIHDPWTIVLQVVLALMILYRDLGLASIAALVASVTIMLANIPLGKLQKKLQEGLMESKDERMKVTSEVMRNMRILKLQNWEMKFLSKIQDLRSVEAGWLHRYLFASAASICVFWGAPAFVSVVTFGACMLMGIPIETGKVLSALATFKVLQDPIYKLPGTISMFVQTKVSLDRIASFLSLDDLQPDIVEKLPVGVSNTAVEVIDGNFSWDVSSPVATLSDINFKVSRGMRVAICGTVGSGKSSLLSCILGEMPKVSGLIRLSGTKAYVAQSAWIQSGKIEENILFGKEMDRQWYNKVLEACCLNRDLEILAFGDQTVIGERGINLSGGQKQRIQIARALYQDADIYLFDDPFSAVDAHTATHIFNECILGLLNSKTVIYVTHQVEFLPAADLIMVMKDGKTTQAGKYNDILKSGSDFMELVGAHEQALISLEAESTISKPTMQKLEPAIDENDRVDSSGEAKAQLVQEEEREKGRVGLSVYWKYITTAYGGLLAPIALLMHILFQILQFGSNYWMAWATPASKDEELHVGGRSLILVYVALSIGGSLCIFGRTTTVVAIAYKTANTLFNQMHHCIFHAPMSFFDSTPSGRILSRASADQSSVDTDVASIISSFAFSLIHLVAIIVVMSQVAWQVFIIFIPVIAVCIWLQQYYICAARELARLCGVCKAPVIQHFSETLSGSITIRSFDQESRFRGTSKRLIDEYLQPKFHSAGAMGWLCFRLQVLSLVTFTVSLIFLISIPGGSVDSSVAGLAVAYGLSLNIMQTWVVECLCYMENAIIAVERMLQYTCIPAEAPLVVESNRPERQWPMQGEVHVQDLQVRYGPQMPLVLRGLTCTFFGGKRAGIVGRTGSGKSTLIQTLFRIVEPTFGHILIDGVDISSIGLHDLRSRLSIIPQDPTMFQGTVRSNLDPLEEYTDQQIWEALDKCQLGDEVRKKGEKLDCAVWENGDNWSVGQRQLVCLGRVLLKKSKVLVLDEATASVDTTTDNMIQQTLKLHFSESTVITIAHRITSVVDSDMVLVVDNGIMKEYDSPERLLEDKASSFAMLVAEYNTRSTSIFQNVQGS